MSSNIIIIRDYETHAEITKIDNVINPLITEQVNDVYDFTFETIIDDKTKHIKYPNIIEVDGDFFQISRVQKVRGDSVSVTVDCEHVSYELNQYHSYVDAFELPVITIVGRMLQDTPFTVGVFESNWSAYEYYAPSDSSIRKRLFDLANLVGGELYFDKYTVHLLNRRGIDDGAEFTLGENLVGVTEEIDTTSETERRAYEVDVLDLTQQEGYEHLKTVGLGDTVRTIDPILEIDVSLRVVRREYNPFQKINPRISIGNVVRDYTEYNKPEPEEPTGGNDYYLQTFQMGDVDLLELSGIEIDNNRVLPAGISASYDFINFNQHDTLQIRLKSRYADYHITIYRYYLDGTSDEITYTEVLNWSLPTQNLEAIGVLVTKEPLDEFDLYEHDFRQYGFSFRRNHIDILREFKVGKYDVLGLSNVRLYHDQPLPQDISALLELEEEETADGLVVLPNLSYRDWSYQIVTYDNEGIPTTYDYEIVKDIISNWQFPNDLFGLAVVGSKDGITQVYAIKFREHLIDKTDLEKAIEKAESLNEEDYTELTWGDLEQALGSAKYIFEDENTTQPLVNQAFSDLSNAIENLIEVANYESLEDAINSAESLNEEDYTEDSWQNLQDVLTIAKSVYEDEEAEQTEIDQATNDLNDAINNLVRIEDEDDTGPFYFMENGIVSMAEQSQFYFEKEYDEILSVTTGIIGDESDYNVTLIAELITTGEKYTSVLVRVVGTVDSSLDIGVQVVGRIEGD